MRSGEVVEFPKAGKDALAESLVGFLGRRFFG